MATRGYIGEYIAPKKYSTTELPPLNDVNVNNSVIYSAEHQSKSSSRSRLPSIQPAKTYSCRVGTFIDQEPEPIYKESYEQLISKKLKVNFPFKLEKIDNVEDDLVEKIIWLILPSAMFPLAFYVSYLWFFKKPELSDLLFCGGILLGLLGFLYFSEMGENLRRFQIKFQRKPLIEIQQVIQTRVVEKRLINEKEIEIYRQLKKIHDVHEDCLYFSTQAILIIATRYSFLDENHDLSNDLTPEQKWFLDSTVGKLLDLYENYMKSLPELNKDEALKKKTVSKIYAIFDDIRETVYALEKKKKMQTLPPLQASIEHLSFSMKTVKSELKSVLEI